MLVYLHSVFLEKLGSPCYMPVVVSPPPETGRFEPTGRRGEGLRAPWAEGVRPGESERP